PSRPNGGGRTAERRTKVSSFQAASMLAESPSANERDRRVASVAKIFLFNVWLSVLGLLIVLTIPVGANFTAIRTDIMKVGDDRVPRFAANLRNERVAPGSPMWDVPQAMTLSTNAEGFRDRDHPVEHPPGVFRVALFGDSFIFGLSLEQNE